MTLKRILMRAKNESILDKESQECRVLHNSIIYLILLTAFYLFIYRK